MMMRVHLCESGGGRGQQPELPVPRSRHRTFSCTPETLYVERAHRFEPPATAFPNRHNQNHGPYLWSRIQQSTLGTTTTRRAKKTLLSLYRVAQTPQRYPPQPRSGYLNRHDAREVRHPGKRHCLFDTFNSWPLLQGKPRSRIAKKKIADLARHCFHHTQRGIRERLYTLATEWHSST